MLPRRRLVSSVANDMNTMIDRNDEEATLQSGHRQWAEEWEREQQDRDKQVVERFLAGRLKQKDR
jgi:hypothetical protein